jgi:hypothetical protein
MVSLRLLVLRSLGIDNLNRCWWWWISRWRNRLGHSDYKDQSQQQNQRWWWWEREGKFGSSVHIGFWALLHLLLFINRKKVLAEIWIIQKDYTSLDAQQRSYLCSLIFGIPAVWGRQPSASYALRGFCFFSFNLFHLQFSLFTELFIDCDFPRTPQVGPQIYIYIYIYIYI